MLPNERADDDRVHARMEARAYDIEARSAEPPRPAQPTRLKVATTPGWSVTRWVYDV